MLLILNFQKTQNLISEFREHPIGLRELMVEDNGGMIIL
jgi:hypothetical protein